MCRQGHVVVRKIFEEPAAADLQGLIVWIPMMPGDSAAAAVAQSESFQDGRVGQGWDGDRRVGDIFAKTLGLTRTAWDVYLLYPSGVTWKEDTPPSPAFWMHQLPTDWGANQEIRLEPARLSREVFDLLESDGR